ncbi:GNAT family N-acetyltransferase [Paenibacillus oryzisoli]|uniref:Uncharacterized protein n=1 Tax=Paenibacillus oryzisoli TaxID=1850517 RepID=A0A198AKM4_9BACL|nr:hypothetical protein [Paenibacillus oryzisoli]OAS21581.1 hypothetical protein A8708_16780 [Paenibacillus oryzisoli]
MGREGQIQHRNYEEIVELILSLQHIEFTVNQVNDEVPDNLDAQAHYENEGSNQCFVKENAWGNAVEQLDTPDIFHIKKFYIYIENCGIEHPYRQELCDVILEYARQQGATTIFLDAPSVSGSSPSFFERNGWVPVSKHDLPIRNRYPDRSSSYHRFDII